MGGRGSGATRGDISEETRLALDKWARNATQIKLASVGKNIVQMPFYSEFNQSQDNARAQVIEKFVEGSSVNSTIYRGIQNLSDKDYSKYTKVGATINQDGLSSWSTNKGTAVGHGMIGNAVVFVQQGSSNARRLGNIAGTDIENEVIMGSKARQVITRVEKENGITFVYTKDKKRK